MLNSISKGVLISDTPNGNQGRRGFRPHVINGFRTGSKLAATYRDSDLKEA